MEPKSSEQLPTPIELTPTSSSPEGSPLNPEREISRDRPQETQNQTPASTPVLPQVQLPTPAPTVDDNQVTVQDDTNPAVAADDDLIEKEWVDKAKKIINDTRDDPHRRETEIGKLQVDYLRKRYGKELGSQE